MQPLSFNPAVFGIGAQVVGTGGAGLAAGTTATTAVTALVPGGIDEVSAQAALAFASEGVEAMMINAMAQEELIRAGAAFSEAAGIYTAVDSANASTLL
ncbi:PE family protein [Mycobacterium sp. M1]|uniref:PE family protein n=1 Tax=Mycolicibacter acidiphilus TaxID=2835306 RepID=A0ABS5RET5_9MYCO|nr:PE domain-containing protein [Mycolicibacter acidiphilus]MBS9532798.1 PE family protein [Mycolicibacter acidiphilus]